jgi:hypothetical protein
MSKIKTHKDLDVWKKAMALAKEVYMLIADFPREEIYGLVSQMRRAAVSIPSNITIFSLTIQLRRGTLRL